MILSKSTILVSTLIILINSCICKEIDDFEYLPKNVKPIRYNITIEPLLNEEPLSTFIGSVTIELKVLEDTENITLHIKDLIIKDELIKVIDSNGNYINISHTSNETKEMYTVHLTDKLHVEENYIFVIENYIGSLGHQKSGFFVAKYNNMQGEKRQLTVTEFEPMDARMAFPCFDEPALKAKFIVNLIRPEGYISVSNEELLRTVDLGNGRYQDVYKETVLMPTYLVAFSISDFKYTEPYERVRILARPEAIDDGSADYILKESVKLLKALEDYTGINYTLNKMDLLAVPEGYFLDGAMENWGLVIYSEEHLLFSKNSSTTVDLQRCTTFTGHEFAHQWFGNLITPKKWNYMWLSEGFAAYFQYHITAIVEPTWRLKEQYVVEDYHGALRSDLLPLTEPINFIFPSKDSFPSPIIFYYKASSVIRMAEHFMTSELFHKALKIYLNRYKFDATEPDYVYNIFQDVIDEANAGHLLGNLSISKIMSTWNTNEGYPVVTVTRNYENGSITFTQEIFSKNISNEINSTWFIPINYFIYNKEENQTDIFKTTTDLWLTTKSITIDGVKSDDWILVNKHQTGYYRINYDITNWKRLIDFLNSENFTIIPPVNRAQFIEDAFQFAAYGLLDYELVFNLTSYISHEDDYIALKSFYYYLGILDTLLLSTEEYDLFQLYVRNSLKYAYNKLGPVDKDNDSHIDKLNRMEILKWMCKFGHSECKSIGLQKLKVWRETGIIPISPDLQTSLLCSGIQIANYEDWNFLLQQYYSTYDRNLKKIYIRSLSCSQNVTILNNFLDMICNSSSTIESTHRSLAFSKIAGSSDTGLDTVLDYIIKNHIDIGTSVMDIADISMIYVPQKFTKKLDVIKETNKLSDIPILFYADNSLSPEDKIMYEKIVEWLLQYREKFDTTNIV